MRRGREGRAITLGTVVHTWNHSSQSERLRWENHNFKASLGSVMRSCQKNTKSKRIGASVTGTRPFSVVSVVTNEVVPAGRNTKEAGC